MSFLAAAALLLSLANLVFTMGVIRRLREHTALIAENKRPVPSMGDIPGDFTAQTSDGEPISQGTLALPVLMAFLTTGCQPCEEAIPHFLAYAADYPGGRDHVIAVVTGPAHETPEYVALLSEAARVVVEDPDGPVQRAFGVKGSPAFGILDRSGIIQVATRRVEDLPALVPA